MDSLFNCFIVGKINIGQKCITVERKCKSTKAVLFPTSSVVISVDFNISGAQIAAVTKIAHLPRPQLHGYSMLRL